MCVCVCVCVGIGSMCGRTYAVTIRRVGTPVHSERRVVIGWCEQVVPFSCLPPQCWVAGRQSGQRAEQTAWWSQDGVRWWRRLSDSETKRRGMVTNYGDKVGKCRQTRGGVRYASPLRLAKYLLQTFDAVQMPVPFLKGIKSAISNTPYDWVKFCLCVSSIYFY